MDRKPKRWALLIGIDNYSSGSLRLRNLRGCVNDVQDMRAVLKENLDIPAEQIALLTSPLFSAAAASSSHITTTTNSRTPAPTAQNIVEKIEEITDHAQPSDFIYFHFSGHGTSKDTIYPDKKSGTVDEAICATDRPIRDLELGDIFRRMEKKGLKLAAVLDCCFAGGMTRLDDGMARRDEDNIRFDVVPGNQWPALMDKEGGGGGGMRHASAIEDWFHRKPDFHLIAACQPQQTAAEYPDSNRKFNGILTRSLKATIEGLRFRLFRTNYGYLYKILDSKIGHLRPSQKQRPLILGDLEQTVFAYPNRRLAGEFVGAVGITIQTNGIFLKHGRVNGIQKGDRYRLLPYSGPTVDKSPDPEATVVEVEETKAELKLVPSSKVFSGKITQADWMASLVSRAVIARAKVKYDTAQEFRTTEMKAAMRRLKSDWRGQVNPLMPVELCFGGSSNKIDFVVSLTKESLKILHPETRTPYGSYMPKLNAGDNSTMTEHLMYVLEHLKAYSMVESFPSAGYSGQDHDYRLEQIATEDGYLATHKLQFWNKSRAPPRTLYVAFFDLNPGWGIEQMIPQESGQMLAVRPGEAMEPFKFNTIMPNYLHRSVSKWPFVLKDTMKLFVSTEQHDLSHYELSDLEDGEWGPSRHQEACKEPSGKWAVYNEVIKVRVPA